MTRRATTVRPAPRPPRPSAPPTEGAAPTRVEAHRAAGRPITIGDPHRPRSEDGDEEEHGQAGDCEPVPGEDREVVALEVADQPPDGDHGGEEGEQRPDERGGDAELVDERPA